MSDGITHPDLPEVYRFTPLAEHELTRLLHVECSDDGTIYCHFRSVTSETLDHEVEFFALSYAWGSEMPGEHVSIDGRPFNVTPHLLAGLKAVHNYHCTEGQPEKSRQVQQMDQIYRKASQVLIWLGVCEDDSQRVMLVLRWMELIAQMLANDTGSAIDLLGPALCSSPAMTQRYVDLAKKIQPHLRPPCGEVMDVFTSQSVDTTQIAKTAHNVYEGFHRMYGIEPEKLLDLLRFLMEMENVKINETSVETEGLSSTYDHIFPEADPFWVAFVRLVGRPWFGRVWTYPEQSLARSAVAFCGNMYIDWAVLHNCRESIISTRCAELFWPPNLLFQALEATEIAPFLCSMDMYRRQAPVFFDGALTFRRVLRDMSGRRATDPRDYIYAIAGLVGGDFRAKMNIDYTASISAVYQNAVSNLFEDRKIDPGEWCKWMFVYGSLRAHKSDHLPSWIPDFSNQRYVNDGPSLAVPCDEHAANTLKLLRPRSPFAFDNAGGLKITGLCLDTIAYCTSMAAKGGIKWLARLFAASGGLPTWSGRLDLHCDPLNLKWIDEMIKLVEYTNKKMHLAAARTLQEYLLLEPEEELRVKYQCLRNLIQQSLTLLDQDANADRAVKKLFLDPSNDALETWGEDLISKNNGRHYFVTEKGRLGYSAIAVESGDQVCYIGGEGEYLQVLSSDLNRYITHACVDGLMGNDLINHVKDAEQWQQFNLEPTARL